MQQPSRLGFQIDTPQRSGAFDNLTRHPIDHTHGIPQTLLHALIHLLRAGSRPDRSCLVRPGLRRGSTGPGPGGLTFDPHGCQTAGCPSTSRTVPDRMARNGTVGPDHSPAWHLTTTAGHLAASTSIRPKLWSPPRWPPPTRAIPARPGLRSKSVGPPSARSARVREVLRPPARSTTNAVFAEAASPTAPRNERVGSGDSTPRMFNLPTPPCLERIEPEDGRQDSCLDRLPNPQRLP